MFAKMYQSDIGIDLGTSKFSICSRSEGILISEPAYIAFRGPPDRPQIVAVGSVAAAMMGKAPEGIQVLSPMHEGVIERPFLASLLLRELAKRAGVRKFFSGRRRAIVGSILGASPIEERAFIEVASSIGTSQVKVVKEPLAAAIGHRIPIDEPFGQMLIDVGSGVTEAIVFGLRKIIAGRSLRIGGCSMDQAIVASIHNKYGVLISLSAARAAKEMISSGSLSGSTITLQGFDSQQRLPRSVTVSQEGIEDALHRPIEQIVDMVKQVLEEIAPELSADLIASGLMLCGGGAYTASLRDCLEAATCLDVRIGEKPSEAVVRGCHSILKYVDLLG